MDLLQVKGNKIVDGADKTVMLRGHCIGGWMNMEDFINGFPGSEEGARETLAIVAGKEKAEYFFNRMVDYFFAEADIRVLKECGANVVRIPLNYRHFEDDMNPCHYKEAGFARLEQIVNLCEKYGIYVILDMHAVPGWQNTDWHSDNSSRHSLFWKHLHFQDRFIKLWEELARRYKDRPVIAGYDLMNEPITGVWRGRFYNTYQPDWDAINAVYKKTTAAIRKIDTRHIVFLEGDNFSQWFSGFCEPFADNLVYSSHNYVDSGMVGSYPGTIKMMWDPNTQDQEIYWDKKKQAEVFYAQEGTKFVQKYNVPLWVSEFGSVYNVPEESIPDRLRSVDDQMQIFNEFGAHWTIWTHKDLGVMGTLMLKPDSPYIQLIKTVREKKDLLNTQFGIRWLPKNESMRKLFDLADYIRDTIGKEFVDLDANRKYLEQVVFSGYTAVLLQKYYAACFKEMTLEELDRVMSSFAAENCSINQKLVDVLKQRT
ncbi:hypothetical protein FACS1894130_01530 [Spirochaetia bacterium]|nr:hypothetical protein FACS1894130_01530 [Spirochaetia bacterium]